MTSGDASLPGFAPPADSGQARLLRAASVFSYLILLGGMLTIVVTLRMVMLSYTSLPVWDGWAQIAAAKDGAGPLSFSWLWAQHNEHRLLIPKLFLLADLSWDHARQTFLLASIMVVQLLHWVVLSWSMRRLGNWRGTLWRSGAGLAVFCLFCPSQWENFVTGFQTCFVLPGLFATVAFASLLLYWGELPAGSSHRRSEKWLLLSLLATLGANYSLASGNLLWPVLVVAALLLRLPIAAVLSYALTGAVSIALYFHNYTRPLQHADPLASLHAPLTLLQYLSAYFGSSWVHTNLRRAEFIGALGLLLAAAAIVRLWSYIRAHRSFAVLLVFSIAFCIASGLITGTGRLNLGLMQAFSSRYQTVALVFWCCLGLLLFCWTSNRRTPTAFVVAQACLLVVMGMSAAKARSPLAAVRQRRFEAEVAGTALLAGANDSSTLIRIHPDPQYVIDMLPVMREQHLSIFSTPLASQLGRPLPSLYAVAPDECSGALESVLAIEGVNGALRISGWAWDRKDKRPASRVVAAAGGVIVGLAPVGDFRPKTRAANRLRSSYIGFKGYVRETQPVGEATLYAILDEKKPVACPFAHLATGTGVSYSDVK